MSKNAKDDADLIYVPAGSFVMGSYEDEVRQLWLEHGWDEHWFANLSGRDWVGEFHPHTVSVDGFWVERDLKVGPVRV
jgi:hypothetical protein